MEVNVGNMIPKFLHISLEQRYNRTIVHCMKFERGNNKL